MARKIDLPALWRGPEIAKWFTTFQNEMNQMFNMYSEDLPNAVKVELRKDAAGKREPGAYRRALFNAWHITFWAGILTSYTLSAIARGRPPTPKEYARDLALYTLGTVPGFGWLVQEWLQGYSSFNPSTMEVFEDIGKIFPARLQSLEFLFSAVARLNGLPATSTRRAARGLYDLSTGKTTDIRRILYSEYRLKPPYMTLAAYREAQQRRYPKKYWKEITRNKTTGKVGVAELRAAMGR